MANKLYPLGREAFLKALVAWDADTLKLVAVDNTYAQNDAHDFLDDVGAGTRIATSAAFSGKTVASGVADANDVTLAAIAAGRTIVGIVVYKDTGVEATSRLIAWFDTKADATPINVPTNGGDVVVTWSNGADKIFRL